MYAARAIASSFVVSFLLLSTAFAQTVSLDEPHVVPHGKTVALASAEYASPFAEGAVIHARADLVLVPVSITDSMNRPVIGLDQENFQLFENKKPQQIRSFSSEDTPVSIGFIVDTSGSMSYKLERAREAVAHFCDQANPQDEFFLITFANDARLASDFTNRAENIENDMLTTRSKGATALLDAIYMGVEKMHHAKLRVRRCW